jgi:hypothetical protein
MTLDIPACDRKGSHAIIAPNKSVSITSPLYAVNMLFTLLQRYVHVTINSDKFSCVLRSVLYTSNSARGTTFVDDSTVQFDGDRAADDFAEKSRGISTLALSHRSVLHDEFELVVAEQRFLEESYLKFVNIESSRYRRT